MMPAAMSILLVEDNPADARFVRELLVDAHGLDAALTHVTRLANALPLLAESTFDVVLLDLSLPDAHGLDTIARLHAAAPTVPIVVMSGNDDEALALRGVQDGVQDYLVKGRVESDTLARALRYAVERMRGERERARQAEALRISEERFRALSAHSADLIVILDGAGAIRYASPSHARVLGHAPEAIEGTYVIDYVHPDDKARVQATFAQHVRQAGTVTTLELRLRHADGSWRLLEAVMNNRRDDSAVRGIIVNSRDITERKRAEDAIRASEARFRTLVEAAPVGACITDDNGIFETVNDAYCQLYGYTREELIGRHFTLIIPPEQRQAVIAAQDLPNRGAITRERDVVTKSGAIRTVLSTVVRLVGPDGRPRSAAFTLDITDRKRAERRLTQLAHYDTLTGLPNRALFHDRLRQALAAAHRYGDDMAVMFLDLDGFKRVNDTLGHEAGDLLLRAVAQRLRDCTRESDTVARLGGDEFTVILPKVAAREDVAVVARKILDTVGAGYLIDGHTNTVTASIGISLYPHDGHDDETLLKQADHAMYQAKRRGKNGYAFYAPDTDTRDDRESHRSPRVA